MIKVELLCKSVYLIRQWHGQEVFDLYYRHSPEMQEIREALVKEGLGLKQVLEIGGSK